MKKQMLTRKGLVEHIRQIMPRGLNEIEKLAFIEVEVAKQFSFDEKYLWGDIGTKEKIYKLAKKEAQKPAKEIKRKLICITMAELFGYVVKEFGFDVRYQTRAPGSVIKTGENEIFKNISDKRQEHVCLIVGLSNGKFIEVDIQDDLARLQTRSKPKAFGNNRHGTKIENNVVIETLDKNLVEDAFRKVYQLGADVKFTDEYIMVLAAILRCKHKNPIEMLQFFMSDFRIERELQNTRCIEANRLYKSILKVCYDVAEGKQFFKEENQAIIEECMLFGNKGQKRYSFCIYAEDSERQVFYVYSKKSRRMVELSQEEILQIMQKDMEVKLRGRPSKLKDKMIAFVKGEGIKTKNLKQKNDEVLLEDIFVDIDEEELE